MIELVVPFSASGGSVVSVNGKMGVVVLTPEDIGALPDGALEGYATEQYVQEQIENIEHPTTDLTGYATETYVDAKIAEAQLGGGEDIDLSAYATKQYVSEQVNAIELMPGPTGPQGPKGQDGYTPVKGVDYFDGQPGKDGKDGYTPVKGVDYFDGVDGQDGADGLDGQDYVLTDEDKAEIASMVEVSGGGSVNIDNQTIIEEDGAIRTAIGGYKYTAPAETMFHFLDESGGLSNQSSVILLGDSPVENAATVFDEAIKGKRTINYKVRWIPSTQVEQVEQSGEALVRWDGEAYVLSGIRFTDSTSKTILCSPSDNYYLKMSYGGRMIEFELSSPEREVYEYVDSRYIDTDYFATRDYVAELIGGIENGTY